jgi:hypothetical protein
MAVGQTFVLFLVNTKIAGKLICIPKWYSRFWMVLPIPSPMTRSSGSRLQQQSDGSAGSILHSNMKRKWGQYTTWRRVRGGVSCLSYTYIYIHTVGTEIRRERERERIKYTTSRALLGCIPFWHVLALPLRQPNHQFAARDRWSQLLRQRSTLLSCDLCFSKAREHIKAS